MGYDHGFGRNREGDVEVMQALGARDGFRVEVVAPVSIGDGRPISSTSIRRAIAGGDLERAAYALGSSLLAGRAGSCRALPAGGARVSRRSMSRPPNPRKLLPPQGVYAVRVQTPGGAHGGMLNLGPRPTFGDQAIGIEAHLFDTSGDWYGALGACRLHRAPPRHTEVLHAGRAGRAAAPRRGRCQTRADQCVVMNDTRRTSHDRYRWSAKRSQPFHHNDFR